MIGRFSMFYRMIIRSECRGNTESHRWLGIGAGWASDKILAFVHMKQEISTGI